MNDDWVKIEDDEPMQDLALLNGKCSVNVMTLDKNGVERVGFLVYEKQRWLSDNGKPIKNVIAWRSL